MPYETHYVDMGKGIHKIGYGVVTSAEILSSAVQRSLDEERNRNHLVKYALIDFSKMTELQATTDTVKKLVEVNRKTAQYLPGSFVAIVAPDDLVFGMSRMWAGFAEELGWTANVFHDRESALEWLRTELGHGNPDDCPFDEFPSLKPEKEKP